MQLALQVYLNNMRETVHHLDMDSFYIEGGLDLEYKDLLAERYKSDNLLLHLNKCRYSMDNLLLR